MAKVGPQLDFNRAKCPAKHDDRMDPGIRPTESNGVILIAVVDFYERLGGILIVVTDGE